MIRSAINFVLHSKLRVEIILGRLLHKRHSVLVVVFDREGRTESSENIKLVFIQILKAEGIQIPVIIGIPDRDIEVCSRNNSKLMNKHQLPD